MENFKKVTMIGLGYIGLPTAAILSKNNVFVHGVDINQKVVDIINQGNIHIVEPDLDKYVKEAVANGLLKASIKPVESDVYVIVVPTPFKGDHEPDISYVEAATRSIIPLLKQSKYGELVRHPSSIIVYGNHYGQHR